MLSKEMFKNLAWREIVTLIKVASLIYACFHSEALGVVMETTASSSGKRKTLCITCAAHCLIDKRADQCSLAYLEKCLSFMHSILAHHELI